MVDFFDETVGWPLDTGYMSLVVEQKLHDKWKFIVDILEGSLQEQFKVKSGDHKLGSSVDRHRVGEVVAGCIRRW